MKKKDKKATEEENGKFLSGKPGQPGANKGKFTISAGARIAIYQLRKTIAQ